MKYHDLTNDIREMVFRDIEIELFRPRGFSSWRSLLGLCAAFLVGLCAAFLVGFDFPLVSFFLPVMIGAYSAINATEVDANSPENAVLWGKVKDNIDFFFAKFHATTGHKHTGGGTDAPLIGVGSIGPGSVGQTQINNAAQTPEAQAIANEIADSTINFTLTDIGGFGFWPSLAISESGGSGAVVLNAEAQVYLHGASVGNLVPSANPTYYPKIYLRINNNSDSIVILHAAFNYIQ